LALNFNIEFNWYQHSEVVFWLLPVAIFKLIRRRLKQTQLRNVCCVHSRFIWHEVLDVLLDCVRDLDHVALNLALEPQREARVMDSCFAGYLDLLDVVLMQDVLQTLFELIIAVAVILQLSLRV